MEDRSKACCFTGHRQVKSEHKPLLERVLLNAIKVLYKRGYRDFIAGGARGFDTAAAKAVLNAKEYLHDIKLILILPCQNQTKNWNQTDIAVYNEILEQADKVMYTSEQYTSGCMMIRNRALVDNSSYCVSYQYRSGGGTSYTVGYAQSKGITVYNAADRIDELLNQGSLPST